MCMDIKGLMFKDVNKIQIYNLFMLIQENVSGLYFQKAYAIDTTQTYFHSVD